MGGGREEWKKGGKDMGDMKRVGGRWGRGKSWWWGEAGEERGGERERGEGKERGGREGGEWKEGRGGVWGSERGGWSVGEGKGVGGRWER